MVAPVTVGAGEGVVHLRADLIAAGARAGADDRDDRRVRRAELAQRAHPLLEHARGEPAPARVEHRDGAVAAERHRQAVGGEHHRADAGSAVA